MLFQDCVFFFYVIVFICQINPPTELISFCICSIISTPAATVELNGPDNQFFCYIKFISPINNCIICQKYIKMSKLRLTNLVINKTDI